MGPGIAVLKGAPRPGITAAAPGETGTRHERVCAIGYPLKRRPRGYGGRTLKL
jgi:hypothetical protein